MLVVVNWNSSNGTKAVNCLNTIDVINIAIIHIFLGVQECLLGWLIQHREHLPILIGLWKLLGREKLLLILLLIETHLCTHLIVVMGHVYEHLLLLVVWHRAHMGIIEESVLIGE